MDSNNTFAILGNFQMLTKYWTLDPYLLQKYFQKGKKKSRIILKDVWKGGVPKKQIGKSVWWVQHNIQSRSVGIKTQNTMVESW